MVGSPHIAVKVIVVAHFVLAVWASMSGCLFESANTSYIFMNAFILAFGMWCIICPESADAVFMFFALNVISILLDIIFISVHASLEGGPCQDPKGSSIIVNTYRFSLGMAILNLILKPLTSFVLYRIYQDRTGETLFPTISIGDHSRGVGGYSNIEQPTYSRQVETAAPYSTVDKSPGSM